MGGAWRTRNALAVHLVEVIPVQLPEVPGVGRVVDALAGKVEAVLLLAACVAQEGQAC